MDCSYDSALRDEELLSFVLNEEPLAIEKQAHLEQCPLCQQRLAEIRRVNNVLVRRLYRIFCPSSTEISLYCEGLLPSDAVLYIVNHVLNCPLCIREVIETRSFIKNRSLEAVTTFSPLTAVRRVIGILLGPQLQLATRGETNSITENNWPRQYRADDINLSLHLTRTSNDNHMLLGILSGVDGEKDVALFEGAHAVLHVGPLLSDVTQAPATEPEPVLSTQVDDLGNFAFSSIPNGKYVLIIHLPDQDIVIEQIIIE
ncbi:MAG: hypothetical protein JO215_16945 [Ktedonobacteraceae bacterium]|nr:hypothetical protein [Ktedonobacteraceae bacterium]